MLFTKNFAKRLILGWVLGSIGSFMGVYLSAAKDFPTGASVVCTFGLMTIAAGIVKMLFFPTAEMRARLSKICGRCPGHLLLVRCFGKEKTDTVIHFFSRFCPFCRSYRDMKKQM
ncbi:MAG: metal ABC transporter permease [Candidatus Aureabacteria bacterium]|nr:metal ABC transporter permease [Candidatus Auribacterota bacterium]